MTPKSCELVHITSFLLVFVHQAQALGCYKCTSTNGSNVNCEDPFNSIDQVYEKECFAPRPSRTGLYPATQCLKMRYCSYSPTEMCYMIRGCVADNGGMNADSEIGRTDHCGLYNSEIIIDDRKVYGCITACATDGCNSAQSLQVHPAILLFSSILFTVLWPR